MGDYGPIFTGGNRPRTYTVGASAVTGGQVLALSGADTVIPSGAASESVAGVAAHDAGVGALVTVWPIPGVTHEVTASAAIAVGAQLVAAAGGQVAAVAAVTTPTAADVTNTRAIIGVAQSAAGAGGVKIQMMGR